MCEVLQQPPPLSYLVTAVMTFYKHQVHECTAVCTAMYRRPGPFGIKILPINSLAFIISLDQEVPSLESGFLDGFLEGGGGAG